MVSGGEGSAHEHAPEAFAGHDGGVWAPVPAAVVASWPAGHFALYVTTNGALWAPYRGKVEEAKLLRLQVGEVGLTALAAR
jgi:hypothetical protein